MAGPNAKGGMWKTKNGKRVLVTKSMAKQMAAGLSDAEQADRAAKLRSESNEQKTKRKADAELARQREEIGARLNAKDPNPRDITVQSLNEDLASMRQGMVNMGFSKKETEEVLGKESAGEKAVQKNDIKPFGTAKRTKKRKSPYDLTPEEFRDHIKSFDKYLEKLSKTSQELDDKVRKRKIENIQSKLDKVYKKKVSKRKPSKTREGTPGENDMKDFYRKAELRKREAKKEQEAKRKAQGEKLKDGKLKANKDQGKNDMKDFARREKRQQQEKRRQLQEQKRKLENKYNDSDKKRKRKK